MRYRNDGNNPNYCVEAGCMLNPGSMSREIGFLREALSRALEAKRRWTVVPSDDERRMMASLLGAVPAPAPAPRAPSGYNPVYDDAREERRARAAIAGEVSEEESARLSRINSESVYFGPDGRPVSTEDGSFARKVKAASETVEPRVVKDPMSALDILANNAAIERIRAESPLTGREAVGARTVPGMPNLPGSSPDDSMKGGESFNSKYGPNISRTDEIVRSAEENDYGRK